MRMVTATRHACMHAIMHAHAQYDCMHININMLYVRNVLYDIYIYITGGRPAGARAAGPPPPGVCINIILNLVRAVILLIISELRHRL